MSKVNWGIFLLGGLGGEVLGFFGCLLKVFPADFPQWNFGLLGRRDGAERICSFSALHSSEDAHLSLPS